MMGPIPKGLLMALVILVCLGLGADASAQGSRTQPGTAAPGDRADALERWNRLSPKERAELRRRFDKLKELPAEERERMERRARRLESEMRETLASLGETERNELEALAPNARRRILRSLVADRARIATARIRDRMTSEEREELKGASPKRRRRILEAFRQRELKRMPEGLAALGAELGLNASELRKIQAGTVPEQRRMIVELVRKRVRAQIEENGLPDGLTQEQWGQMLQFDDARFLRVLQRVRARSPELGVPPGRFEARLRRRAALATRLEALAEPTDQLRRTLPKAKEPRIRRQAIIENRRRIEEMLIRQGRLGIDLAARFRALPDDKFVQGYRHALTVIKAGLDIDPALRRWFRRRDAADSRGERSPRKSRPK